MKNDVLCSRRHLSLASGGSLASLWVMEMINTLRQGRLFVTYRCIHKACGQLSWNNIIGPAVYSGLQKLFDTGGHSVGKVMSDQFISQCSIQNQTGDLLVNVVLSYCVLGPWVSFRNHVIVK